MFDYLSLKNKAIDLRKQGRTYSEILKEIKVAKSTLSLWLRDVGLSKQIQHKITEKKLLSAKRGGLARKKQADQRRFLIHSASEKEIGKISKREFWLIGASLYWAEGSKEKLWRAGSGVKFTNSDPVMIKIFYYWLRTICKVKDSDIELYFTIHETNKERVEECIGYWAKNLGVKRDKFKKVYFKKNKINTRRQNVGNQYYGIVSIVVLKSSALLRQITGWTQGIGKHWEIV